MSNRLILTTRDEGILHDCYENSVMSFSQVMKRHFAGKAVTTATNRLSRLHKRGYLKKTRVGIMIYAGSPHEVGVVYQLGFEGLKHLKTRCTTKPLKANVMPLNPATLNHDLILNDCLEKLRLRFPGAAIVNGKNLEADRGNGKRRPDAVIVTKDGHPSVAIELELNAKSETRYRQIILQYSLDPAFQSVLYVVGNPTISDKIKFQVTGQKDIKGLPPVGTGKFYFASLEDLLRNPKTVSISNGSGLLFV